MAPRFPQRSTLRVAMLLAGGVGLAGGMVIACSLALDFSGIDDGVRDGAPGEADGSSGTDGQADGASPLVDGSTDALATNDAPVASPDAASDGGCPSLPGPTLVLANGFCIDSTEITVTEYTAFLTAQGGNIPAQSALCSWNDSLLPFGWPQSGPANAPVVSANWCQAALYCQWAGKRLCGNPGGGPTDPNEWFDQTQSEWYAACSHENDGLHTYPYGNAYEPNVCNGPDYDAGTPLPSLASCGGGYPGLFDMSGNVFEWEDSCAGADGGAPTGANDYCHTRGGGYTMSTSTILRCDDGTAYTRNSQAPFVGFRCCTQ